jgi:hemoglobin
MAVQSHYQRIGGESAVRRLVDAFYAAMEVLPEAAAIRAMHPGDLSESRERLFLFLSGWLGGPQLYTEKFGHPRLRARHLPFAIGESERDAWLSCMRHAMASIGLGDELRLELDAAFTRTADFMRNQNGRPAGG